MIRPIILVQLQEWTLLHTINKSTDQPAHPYSLVSVLYILKSQVEALYESIIAVYIYNPMSTFGSAQICHLNTLL